MINKVILIGHIGRDAELKYTSNSYPVSSFTLATTTKTKDENKTEWHNIKLLGTFAENLSKYLLKGSLVYVCGKISYSSFDGKNGKSYFTSIIADEIKLLNKKEDNHNSVYDNQHVPPVIKKENAKAMLEQAFSVDDVPF